MIALDGAASAVYLGGTAARAGRYPPRPATVWTARAFLVELIELIELIELVERGRAARAPLVDRPRMGGIGLLEWLFSGCSFAKIEQVRTIASP